MLYQYWKAQTRFFCNGRLRLGPRRNCLPFLYLHSALALPLALLLGFGWAVLWEKCSPAVPICLVFLYLGTTLFALLTTCSDPGVIPNKSFASYLRKRGKIDQAFVTSLGQIEQQFATLRVCKTCLIVKPEDANHCSECGHCVEVLDHHCPFLNNCVAKRNYQFFFFFLVFLNVYILTYIAAIVVFFVRRSSDGENRVAIIVISVLFGAVALVLVVFLAVHFVLTLSNKTTRDVLTGRERGRKQARMNWFRLDPVLINFDEEVAQQDLHLLHQDQQFSWQNFVIPNNSEP